LRAKEIQSFFLPTSRTDLQDKEKVHIPFLISVLQLFLFDPFALALFGI
jgi:hypothetical protein